MNGKKKKKKKKNEAFHDRWNSLKWKGKMEVVVRHENAS